MHIGHSSSSESRPCVMCGKKTATYKIYTQSNMDVRVPLCDSMERPSCYSKADIKVISERFLIDVKKAIKASC
jgi:hypothetical protein